MKSQTEQFLDLLAPYKNKVEEKIASTIETLGPKTELRDACEYALLNGGKRFRPALVYLISEALGGQHDVSPAAMAIEFFHTASLIADDLPCMDNDDMRRNKPSLHKAFGEATALLASYALISAGYGLLAENAKMIKGEANQICILALENVTKNTGFFGATGGQFLDIFPKNLSENGVLEILHKKTVSLFEISFVLGWLFGGGEPKKLNEVKKFASHFGIAFQIADDFQDAEQDAQNKRKINIVNICGRQRAKQLFDQELSAYQTMAKKLKIDSTPLLKLSSLLNI